MTEAVILLVGLAAAGGLFGLFVRWDRMNKEHFVVVLLLGMLVTESSLYENQDLMPATSSIPAPGLWRSACPRW